MLGKPEEKSSKGKKSVAPLLTKADLKRYEEKILSEEKPLARIGDDQLEPPADLVNQSD